MSTQVYVMSMQSAVNTNTNRPGNSVVKTLISVVMCNVNTSVLTENMKVGDTYSVIS